MSISHLDIFGNDKKRCIHLPNNNSLTSLDAFSPSILRVLSICLDLSAAARSSLLTAQPILLKNFSLPRFMP